MFFGLCSSLYRDFFLLVILLFFSANLSVAESKWISEATIPSELGWDGNSSGTIDTSKGNLKKSEEAYQPLSTGTSPSQFLPLLSLHQNTKTPNIPTMAWTCSSTTNSGLISSLVSASLLKTPRVISAFKSIDRAHFSPYKPYQDSPQQIGFGATISAPHMHAMAVEELEDKLVKGARVLDVGCGSGYLVGVFHKLVSDDNDDGEGYVLGIDHLPSLTSLSYNNLLHSLPPSTSIVLSSQNSPLPTPLPSIEILTADGRLGSPPSHTPAGGWDVIHVGAAAPSMPEILVNQLKKGGRMFIPVGRDGGDQFIWRVDKDEVTGEVRKEVLCGVRYVPLVVFSPSFFWVGVETIMLNFGMTGLLMRNLNILFDMGLEGVLLCIPHDMR